MLPTLVMAAAGVAATGSPSAPNWLLGAGLAGQRETVTETVTNGARSATVVEAPLPEESLALDLVVERRLAERWWLSWVVSGSADRQQTRDSGGALVDAPWLVVSRASLRLTAGPRVVLARGLVEFSLTTGLTAALGWIGLESLDAEGATVAQGDQGAASVGARLGFALDRTLAGPLAVRLACGLVEANLTESLGEPVDHGVSEVALRPRAALLLTWAL